MTDTNSAPDVTWGLYLSDDEAFVSLKCTPCDRITEHLLRNLQPMPNETTDLQPSDIMNKSRRVQMCTECGNLALKK